MHKKRICIVILASIPVVVGCIFWRSVHSYYIWLRSRQSPGYFLSLIDSSRGSALLSSVRSAMGRVDYARLLIAEFVVPFEWAYQDESHPINRIRIGVYGVVPPSLSLDDGRPAGYWCSLRWDGGREMVEEFLGCMRSDALYEVNNAFRDIIGVPVRLAEYPDLRFHICVVSDISVTARLLDLKLPVSAENNAMALIVERGDW